MGHYEMINVEANQSRAKKSDFSWISFFLSSLLDSNFSLVRAAGGGGGRGERGGRQEREKE